MEKTGIQYGDAVQKIKSAILQSQYRVASEANGELLSLFYGIGKYVSERNFRNYWNRNKTITLCYHYNKRAKCAIPS